MLSTYVDRWHLTPDGIPFDTPHSWLLAVRHQHAPAILKICKPASDETATAQMLEYYAGDGAVRLIAADGAAVLMERACGVRSLWAMTINGRDDAAAAILADVVAALHVPRATTTPSGLTPLRDYFQSLFQRRSELPQLTYAADIAEALLANPRDVGVLHGDLHHNNVVFDEARGWLAIDPKGLWGECAYEVANLMRNPQYHPAIVHDEGRMLRHAQLYATRLGLDTNRILSFVAVHAALSVAWCLDDDRPPAFNLRTTEIALSLLDK